MSTSIQEWLLSAEYVLSGGNPNVILCERGIRTLDRDAVHPGPQRGPGREEALAPAGGRGPEPRHGPLGVRGVHGPGGGGGRGGRADHRGAPAARGGAV